MMLLAEIARKEGLFDWLAAQATRRAQGSATPPLPARLRGRRAGDDLPVQRRDRGGADAGGRRGGQAAKANEPLPYLLICAFIANAASFVLPISNPANLVLYGSHMPPLLVWLPHYLARLGARDSRYLWRAALDPARGAAPGDRRRVAVARPVPRRAGSPRRASRRPRSRCSPPRRSTSSSACRPRSPALATTAVAARRRAQGALGHGQGYLLGRAAARRRPVRAGRGAGQERPDRACSAGCCATARQRSETGAAWAPARRSPWRAI